MTKTKWRNIIKKAAVDAGTYKEYFDSVIETLAEILEQRDRATEQLNRIGEDFVIEGHRNPLVVIWNELNKSALAYWKELGLTPAGLKKLNEDTFAERKQTLTLLDQLKKIKEEQ